MKKPRSKKKNNNFVLCVLLALAVLTPCVINAVVMLSASKVYNQRGRGGGTRADCVLVLGAKVNSNGTLSHMLEDRMSTGVDLYQSGAGKDPRQRRPWQGFIRRGQPYETIRRRQRR